MTTNRTPCVTQADVDYIAELCADRKGAWRSKVMRALIAIQRRTAAEAASRQEVDRLREALETAAGRLRWAGSATPGAADPEGKALVLRWSEQAFATLTAAESATHFHRKEER